MILLTSGAASMVLLLLKGFKSYSAADSQQLNEYRHHRIAEPTTKVLRGDKRSERSFAGQTRHEWHECFAVLTADTERHHLVA